MAFTEKSTGSFFLKLDLHRLLLTISIVNKKLVLQKFLLTFFLSKTIYFIYRTWIFFLSHGLYVRIKFSPPKLMIDRKIRKYSYHKSEPFCLKERKKNMEFTPLRFMK